MFKLSEKMDYGEKMDSECVELCDALNSCPGIKTSESCCGHGKTPFRVWFSVECPLTGLFFVTRCCDRRYWEHGHEWSLTLSVGDLMKDDVLPIGFLLQSAVLGEEANLQAIDLVRNMNLHLNHKNFIKGYGLHLIDFHCEGAPDGCAVETS